MLSIDEKDLVKKLHKLKKCPLCGMGRQDGGHVDGCELYPYMKFLPKDLKIGDKVGLQGYDYDEYYPCVVTEIIDDFTCSLYEQSIDTTHIHGAPIMMVDDDGKTHWEG